MRDVPADVKATGADSVLEAIERRTARVLARSRRALAILLGEQQPEWDDIDSPRAPQAIYPRVTLAHLEHYAPHWRPLVPDDPITRAALARMLEYRYGARVDALPSIQQALGWDDDAVAAAYSQLTGELTPESLADAPMPGAAAEESLWREIDANLEWLYLQKGDILFRQGEPSDSMCILISGRLHVATEQADGTLRVIAEVGRSEVIGEMGVLTGEPRSATVLAARDSELLMLSRAAFDRLVERRPVVLRQLAKTNINRLRDTIQAKPVRNTVATIAVVPLHPGLPVPTLAQRLAEACASYGPTLYLNRTILDSYLYEGASDALQGDGESRRVIAWLNDRETEQRFVIYDADPAPTAWTMRCIRQSDRVLLVGDADADPAPTEIEKRAIEADASAATPRQDLVLLHLTGRRRPRATGRWLERRHVHTHYHVDPQVEEDMRRLAQRLIGQGVGLVLGGGGARGFAHIGVLRALREAGIPITIVGGASSGALVAAQYAMGWDIDTIFERNRQLIVTEKNLIDYTIPIVSLLSARKFTHLIDAMFGDRQIEDLWLEYFCVSSNLTRAELEVHRRGHLARYVRASCSIPGVVPPLLNHGDLLVDGGVLNMLPVDVMNGMCDGGPVIAVDVSGQFDLSKPYHFGESVSGLELIVSRINPFARTKLRAPNLVSIMLRTAELSSVREQGVQARRADLFLNPPVAQFGVLDLKCLDTFVDVGYRYASEKIAEWKAAGGHRQDRQGS